MATVLDPDLVQLRELVGRVTRLCTDIDAILSRRLTPAAVPADQERLRGLPRTRAIEAVLVSSGRALRPVEIWAALQEAGREDPKMEVQVTTFDLWKRGRIGKVGRGLYTAALT